MRRNQLLNSLLVTLLLIAIISFPVDMFLGWLGYEYGTDSYKLAFFLSELILHLILILFYVIQIQKSGIRIAGFANYKMLLIFLPTILIIGTNMYMFIYFPNQLQNGISLDLLYDSVLAFCTAIVEEIVFRLYIHNMLPIRNRLVKVIASAGIFGIMHGLGFITTFDPYYLIQIVYTFGIGIVLGLIYEYGHSLIASMTFHFFFNFVNDCLYIALFKNSFPSLEAVNQYQLVFYLNAVGVGVVVGLYILFIFLFYINKKNKNGYYTFDMN